MDCFCSPENVEFSPNLLHPLNPKFLWALIFLIPCFFVINKFWRTFGFRSLPCCMRVPMVNQKLFASENWFSTISGPEWQGCGLFHSYGLKRATTNIVTDTSTYAASTYSQISIASGFMKENNRAGWLVGTWNKKKLYPQTASGRTALVSLWIKMRRGEFNAKAEIASAERTCFISIARKIEGTKMLCETVLLSKEKINLKEKQKYSNKNKYFISESKNVSCFSSNLIFTFSIFRLTKKHFWFRSAAVGEGFEETLDWIEIYFDLFVYTL